MRGHLQTHGQAARIVSDPQGFFSSEIIFPLRNAWLVASRPRLTSVDAGGESGKPANGIFGIFRHTYVGVRQASDVVRVIGSGPIRITAAPLGRTVETAAQKDGELRFRGSRGVTGTFYLKDDSVKLDSP